VTSLNCNSLSNSFSVVGVREHVGVVYVTLNDCILIGHEMASIYVL